MDAVRLAEILDAVSDARIALIGDFCLDVYWKADMRLSELSRETPHHPLPIVSESYSPGGAGNVANNISTLKPGLFLPISVVGKDWRGELLLETLRKLGIPTDGIIQADGYITNTYIKPLRSGISDVVYEDPRLDFENRAPIDSALSSQVNSMLEAAIADTDVICVSDQMRYGCITDRTRSLLSTAAQNGKKVIVDSRDRIADYVGCIVKPNEIEASRAYTGGKELSFNELCSLAGHISNKNGAPAIITIGENGCIAADKDEIRHIPAKQVEKPVDIVGAGDTFLSALGTTLAAGANIFEACEIANAASAVTVKKLNTTGTATKQEITVRMGAR